MNNSTVSLNPEVLTHNAFSDYIRNHLEEVDLTKGEIVKHYPNPEMVCVRFPVKPEYSWKAKDLIIDLGAEDLIAKVEVDCPECNGACYVECISYSNYEPSMTQCGTCDGAGTVFVDDVPQQNILPVEVLISSNELPF